MPKFNLGFKYQIGQHVTHKSYLQPKRQPAVPRYTVVSQLLETGPSGPEHFYYLRREEQHTRATESQIRASEAHLAPVPLAHVPGEDE